MDGRGWNIPAAKTATWIAADVAVVRRVLDTAVDCGCAVSAGLAAAGRAEYKGGCVAAGGCTRVHEEFRGQCFVFLLVFC